MKLSQEKIEKIKNRTVSVCKICHGTGFITEQKDNTIVVNDCSCIEIFKKQILYLSSGISSTFWEWGFKDLWPEYQQVNEDFLKVLYGYASDIKKLFLTNGLFIQGPPGVGKSAVANVLLRTAIENGYSGYFVDCDKLIRLAFQEISDHDSILKELSDLDIIVIDEIDKPYFPEKRTSYGEARLREFFRDIEYRDTLLIATSNQTKEWLQNNKIYDTSVLDRIWGLNDIILLGNSFRRKSNG